MNSSAVGEANFLCLGINHSLAQTVIRKQFALDPQGCERMLMQLCADQQIFGAVVLSTCNRTEYFISSSLPAVQLFSKIEKIVAEQAGCGIYYVRRYFVYYSQQKAVRHLFRIVSGLDSLTVGEYEISGQVRSAYQCALNLRKTDWLLNIIFQKALHYAKIIRCQSEFSNTGLSYGTLVANEISALNLKSPRILLLGASGQLGSLVLRTLLNRGCRICATEHRYPVKYKHPLLTTVSYEKRYEVMADFDAVISATSSPHYTVTCRELCEISGIKSVEGKRKLFIDLAVPCDLDPDLDSLKNCTLINFSYFENIIKEHQSIRNLGAAAAGCRIDDFVDETWRRVEIHRYLRSSRAPGAEIDNFTARELFFMMQNEASEEQLALLYNLYGKALKSSRTGRKLFRNGGWC